MDPYVFQESDWKLYRSRRPAWEEAYLERKIREYAALLAGPEKASDKFFALGKKIEKDQRQLYVKERSSRPRIWTVSANNFGK